jgi:hypothetical protein
MGVGIISPIRKNGHVELGSSGPWVRISDTDVVLYTAEHVVRPGKSQGVNHVITCPERAYLGEVTLSSTQEADTTMESTNPKVQSGKDSFLADWAVIKLRNTPHEPITMPGTRRKLCHHVNDIVNVPDKGTAVVVGAASRKHQSEPWKGTYRCPIINDGLPTTLSPGSWGNNTNDLHCWSLSCPRGMDKEKWFNHGIGIKGDSGAGVVDWETGSLCGLVIGETKGWLTSGHNYRKAIIIDMLDVMKDTVKTAIAVNANPDFSTAEVIGCDCRKGSTLDLGYY